MSLRAVVFDYGMVLTGLPNAAAHDAMVRIAGVSAEQFERLYWADRHAYDEGRLSGVTFWQKFARDANLSLSAADLDELNRQDALMWTTQNPAMVSWQRKLKAAGVLTAILSNMGDSVLENIKREFRWIDDFDVLVWSYQLHMAKPDAAIYRDCLRQLGCVPDKSLFFDDRRPNVEAARRVGIDAHVFESAGQARAIVEGGPGQPRADGTSQK